MVIDSPHSRRHRSSKEAPGDWLCITCEKLGVSCEALETRPGRLTAPTREGLGVKSTFLDISGEGYRRFVESGVVEPMTSPLEEAKWQAILGSENFQQAVRDRFSGWNEKKRREVKAARQTGPVVPVERIVTAVARAYDMTIQAVREQRGRDQEAKGVAMGSSGICAATVCARSGQYLERER